MRTRTLIAALIFLSLSAVKLFLPEKTSEIREVIVPAVSRDVSLRDDILALGHAISGGGNYVYVWERWMGSLNKEPGITEPPQESAAPSTSNTSATSENFKLSSMIRQNLLGYEDLACIPKEQVSAETLESQNDPSPSPFISPSPLEAALPEGTGAETISNEQNTPEPASLTSEKTQNEKVDAFLREQAAFSDYALPSNVSYESPELPFEYLLPVQCSVTSGFGYRVHPIDGVVKFHYGSDFGVVDGTDVLAFADGTVISAQEFDGYGITVILDHGNDYTTLYAHCGQILVKQGDKVKKGDKIALSGHSGRVTGPHMHFELMKNGIYLNPEFYV